MTLLNRNQAWAVAGITAVLLFFAYTVWSGLPSEEERLRIFWPQVVIFFVITVVYVAVFWHLLVRPLKGNVKGLGLKMQPARSRQIIALIVASGGLAIVIGAFWDGAWHRIYGVPLGEDFLWRPHLLMYFGFVTTLFCGFWALGHLLFRCKGSFQQRFRANPLEALLVLNAAYLMYGLPADPIWHSTYGEDITAWSVPHFILFASFLFTLLLGNFAHASTIARGPWRSIFNFQFSDLLPIFVFASVLLGSLQILLSPFDRELLNGLELLTPIPDGALPLNILMVSAIVGVLGTRLFRCYGLATVAGLLALFTRWGLIQALEASTMYYVGWIVPLVPLVAIDLWTWHSVTKRGEEPEWRGTALVLIAAMVINSFAIFNFYGYAAPDLISAGLAVVLGSIGSSWMCHQMADWMDAKRGNEPATSAAAQRPLQPGVYFGALAVFVVCVIYFIFTATPPV